MFIILDFFNEKAINVINDECGQTLSFESHKDAYNYAVNNLQDLFWRIVKV